MDFTLSAQLEDLRLRVKAFVNDEIMPLEADPANFDDHEMIDETVLAKIREKAKSVGLWAPQMPTDRGGLGLNTVGMAVL